MLALLTVTTNQDVVDLTDGQLSLREAIFVANTVAGVDEIEFDFGHDGPETIVLTQGELAITDSLTITGAGAELLTIDASGNDPTPDQNNGDGSRVFNISDGNTATTIDVTFKGLTITGGDVTGMGGGLLNVERTSALDVRLQSNAATSSGGAIRHAGGSLIVMRSEVLANHSASTGVSGGGGGLSIAGGTGVEIVDSTVAENSSRTGGGVDILGGSGTVSIANSHVDRNWTTGGGAGGIWRNGTTTLSVVDSTVDNNTASGRGGGMEVLGFGSFLLANSSVSGNRANGQSFGIAGGGGIVFDVAPTFGTTNSLVIRGSRIADNWAVFDGGGLNLADTSRLEIEDSKIVRNTAGRDGGGVYATNSILTITNSLVAENEAIRHEEFSEGYAITSRGGGVYAGAATRLQILSSAVRDNSTTGNGGGVYVVGRVGTRPVDEVNLLMRDSQVSDNVAGEDGGGLYLRAGAHAIVSSTIARNVAQGSGGGAYLIDEPNFSLVGIQVDFHQTTISQNRADGDGGGISDRSDYYPYQLQRSIRYWNTTIADNIADSNGDGVGSFGGLSPATGVSLRNSIVANNRSFDQPDDLQTVPVQVDYSLVETLKAGVILSGTGNITGQDPQLGPLAYNGGPIFVDGSRMLTHALLAESPAIDAGDPMAVAGMNGVPEFDQRGEPHLRVRDGDATEDIAIDIGAYEREFGETYTFVVDTLIDESDGDYSAGDFSLREATLLSNGNPGADVITFDPALWANGPATIVLTHDFLHVRDAVTIHGPGAELLTIDASGSDPTPDSTLDDGNDANDGDGTVAFVINDLVNENRFAVELSGMTLTGGDSSGAGAIGSGENLRLVEVVVSGNSSTSQAGGIAQSGGELTVIGSVISHNDSRKHGGGIFVFGGSLSVSDSVVSNNTTRDDFGLGGGIAVENGLLSSPGAFVRIERSVISQNSTRGAFAPGGLSVVESLSDAPILVTIIGSTISDNTASGHVAGVYLSGAKATIEESTISSNRYVSRAGVSSWPSTPGGIYLDSSELSLVRSTVVDNLGRRPGFGDPVGSGIHVQSGSTLLLDHSIVARNRWTTGPGNPVDVVIEFGKAAARSSLIGAADGMFEGGGNLIGMATAPIDPQLGPLAYNGGAVFLDGTRMPTHLPLPGSPVIDIGLLAVADPKTLYRFEEPVGPTASDSIGDFDGMMHGDPTLGQPSVIGQLGSAIKFDGADDFVSIPRTVADDFSFAFWVKTSQANGTWAILGGDVADKSNDFSVLLNGGQVEFRIGDWQTISNTKVNDGQWHFVVVTRDLATNTRLIYVDGLEDVWFSHATFANSPLNAATELRLGQKLTGDGQFEGWIDEFAVYERVLNASEVFQLATLSIPEFDQRGAPWSRVANGDDMPEARIDIGAVERQANPLPGDYSFNGIVDAADYSVWRDTLGSTIDLRADGSSATTPGEPDGVVDEHDHAWWKANFGNVLSVGRAAVGAGFEPQAAEEGGTAGQASSDTPVALLAPSSQLGDQPSALRGVAPVIGQYLMVRGPSALDAGLPPADPEAGYPAGADGRVGESSVNYDAALIAWAALPRSASSFACEGIGFEGEVETESAGGIRSLDELFAELEFALAGSSA